MKSLKEEEYNISAGELSLVWRQVKPFIIANGIKSDEEQHRPNMNALKSPDSARD